MAIKNTIKSKKPSRSPVRGVSTPKSKPKPKGQGRTNKARSGLASRMRKSGAY